jgi:expansin (peptidoglycan-binding protein)
VTDKCPGCPMNFLNLFEPAYNALARDRNNRDKIDISWDVVSCLWDSPLAVQNKEGTSQYWFSMQVQNSNWPIKSMEVSTNGGRDWQNTASRDYNFFEKSNGGGYGVDRVDLRISCANGNVVMMTDVEVRDKSKVWATSNC